MKLKRKLDPSAAAAAAADAPPPAPCLRSCAASRNKISKEEESEVKSSSCVKFCETNMKPKRKEADNVHLPTAAAAAAPYLRRCDLSIISKEEEEEQWEAEEVDVLFGKKCGKQHLIRCNSGELVDVMSLKGKHIGLLIVNPGSQSRVAYLSHMFNTYSRLNQFRPNSFEIVYLLIPPDHSSIQQCSLETRSDGYKQYDFTTFVSTFPFLAIPFPDEDWRRFLCNLYAHARPDLQPVNHQLAIIDHFGTLLDDSALPSFLAYGHLCYPFTLHRRIQLKDQFESLPKETSINALLASSSNRGYLIDRNHNKVPISALEAKHVALYFPNPTSPNSDAFLKQLVEIYTQFCLQGFEIVFVNFSGFGYEDETSFNHALREMPWLALPFDDVSCWTLYHIFFTGCFLHNDYEKWYHDPILFIRAKGEALLDPYGYHVINRFGLQAYPFTRRAALTSERRRLKENFTFKSFLKQAKLLGLDFSTLIRNKSKQGDTEEVSLSDLNLKKRHRGVLLVFAKWSEDTQKALSSLKDAYTKQDPAFSFEVVYVSLDKKMESFRSHFSGMPWFAFGKPLEKKEHKILFKRTIRFNHVRAHCIAFGYKGNFLRTGELPESFENRVFPFIEDVEFVNSLGMSLYAYDGWTWSVDKSLGVEDTIDWLDD